METTSTSTLNILNMDKFSHKGASDENGHAVNTFHSLIYLFISYFLDFIFILSYFYIFYTSNNLQSRDLLLLNCCSFVFFRVMPYILYQLHHFIVKILFYLFFHRMESHQYQSTILRVLKLVCNNGFQIYHRFV